MNQILFIGSTKYKNYLLSILKELIDENKCFTDNFTGYDEFYSMDANYDFVYCKNEEDIKNKLNDLISTINFASKELNYIFELTKDEILKENGEYIFFNIIFSGLSSRWNLGKQITLKYQFIFNPEPGIKSIFFYPKFKTNENNSNKSKIWLIILIIVLCVIFCALGVVIGKILYGIAKKKRANELKDDYEYCPEEKKEENRLVTGE